MRGRVRITPCHRRPGIHGRSLPCQGRLCPGPGDLALPTAVHAAPAVRPPLDSPCPVSSTCKVSPAFPPLLLAANFLEEECHTNSHPVLPQHPLPDLACPCPSLRLFLPVSPFPKRPSPQNPWDSSLPPSFGSCAGGEPGAGIRRSQAGLAAENVSSDLCTAPRSPSSPSPAHAHHATQRQLAPLTTPRGGR